MYNKKAYEPIQHRVIKPIAVASMISILLLWFIITHWGIVKPMYLPTPKRVITAAVDIGPNLLIHIGATLARVLVGFSFGALSGVTIGVLMSSNNLLFSALSGIIECWRPVPPIALIPFFILWFGFSDIGKIILVALGVFLILVVNTLESIRNVRPIYVRVGMNLGASKSKLYRSIILPAILPSLISGFRISMALSISLVIVSEFMGATWGLGYLISVAKVTFSTHTILLSIFIIGIISWLLDTALRKTTEIILPWAEKSTEAIVLL